MVDKFVEERFWRDRPTLVTGATGLLGGWLVRRLLERRADVVCLVRDWVPGSQLICEGLSERVKLVPVSYTHLDVYKRQISAFS